MKKLLIFLSITLVYLGCSDNPANSNNDNSGNTFTSYDFEENNTFYSFSSNSGDSVEPAKWDLEFSYINYYAWDGCQLERVQKDPLILLGENVSAVRVDAGTLDDVTTLPAAESFKQDVDKIAVIGGNYLDASYNYTMDVYAIKTCAGNYALVQIDKASYDPTSHHLYNIRLIVKYNMDGSRNFSATNVDTMIVPDAYSTAQYYSFFSKGTVSENDAFDLTLEGYKVYLGNGTTAKNLGVQDIESVASISDDEWVADTPGIVTYDWYNYDFSTHTVTPKDYVYVIKTADEKYLAFRITSIYDDYGNYGSFSMSWKEMQ